MRLSLVSPILAVACLIGCSSPMPPSTAPVSATPVVGTFVRLSSPPARNLVLARAQMQSFDRTKFKGKLVPLVRYVLATQSLSKPLHDGSAVRIPNDDGWRRLDRLWPIAKDERSNAVRDADILRICGVLQSSPDDAAALAAIEDLFDLSS